jgi:hypothetical protein
MAVPRSAASLAPLAPTKTGQLASLGSIDGDISFISLKFSLPLLLSLPSRRAWLAHT